ncbi:hypothetical protein M9Y10_003406 [Tritrichomonas musculus]|uniref:F5/8 type C domain-containing protein n=1 Tax=Tritrichomonas musculus TaxID=1915356 RepID=A0ABR2JPV3_9EUKA
MSLKRQVYLKPSSIFTVPLQTYAKDFLFVVNGEEFRTSRIISDILSPVICKIHSNDPTFDTFIINTQNQGNFSHILDLTNFKTTDLLEEEIPFISEVIKILGNKSIECQYENDTTEITLDNVLHLLQLHEKYGNFYCNHISREIEFSSLHFHELCESQGEEMKNLSVDTLMLILKNDQLKLKNEDQLLKFINKLYSNDVNYSILYETVLYTNVSSEEMIEFVSLFDASEMSYEMWKGLSKRLCQEIDKKEENLDTLNNDKSRYIEVGKLFEYTEDKVFKGIFNYFQTETNGQIEKEIDFTSSSLYSISYPPKNVALFDDKNSLFISQDVAGSWICFDFKDHRVTPTHYTMRSYCWSENNWHPRNWVVEGSCDNSKWEIIDDEKECSLVRGSSLVHTFKMNQPKSEKFKYIKLRATGPNWYNNNYFAFESLELYGWVI